ncbi:hypothetical protein [Streptomyces sp. NPDC001388]
MSVSSRRPRRARPPEVPDGEGGVRTATGLKSVDLGDVVDAIAL